MTDNITRRALTAGAAMAAIAGPRHGQALAADNSMTFVGFSQTEIGSRAFLEQMFADFRAQNPTINLEIVGAPYGQLVTTLNLRRRAGQRCDVAQMQESWLPLFGSAGVLVDVDQALGSNYATDTFLESTLPLTMFRGKRLGLPWISGSILMVANLKTMADAGLQQMPTTIDEFVSALRAVKRAKPASSPMGLTTKGAALTWSEAQIIFWQFGAHLINPEGEVLVDSPASRQALGFLTDLVREGLILPGNDRFDFRRLFAQELVAFYIDAPGARTFSRAQSGQGEAYDRFVKPIAMPVVNRGDAPLSAQWGHLAGFFSQGGAHLAPDSPSGRFVQHIMKTETQVARFRATGLFPSTRAALDQIRDDPYLVDWLRNSAASRRDETIEFANATELQTIAGEEVTAAMLGQKTVDAAITSMATRLRAAPPQR